MSGRKYGLGTVFDLNSLGECVGIFPFEGWEGGRPGSRWRKGLGAWGRGVEKTGLVLGRRQYCNSTVMLALDRLGLGLLAEPKRGHGSGKAERKGKDGRGMA